MLRQFDNTQMERNWATDPRWKGVTRTYTAKDVLRLRGTIHIEHSLARLGAERLWQLLNEDEFVSALGALTGNQALQQVQAGLTSISPTGWQPAAQPNLAVQIYPT